jgi:hypothetical protein
VTEKVEFASREWVIALRRIIEESVTDDDLAGVEFSMSEEFTDPPARLVREGSSSIGWQLRVRDGKAEVIDGPASDVDIHIVADYAFIVPEARRIVGDQSPEDRAAHMATLLSSGKFRIEGSGLGNAPAFLERINLHDKLAVITA